MKIRTKIVLLIVFITIITTFYTTYYILKTIVNEELQWEYQSLSDSVSLTTILLEDKYYDVLSNQLLNVYLTKKDIKEKASILRATVLGTNPELIEKDPNYQDIIKNLIRNINSIDISFLIYENNTFKGSETALEFIKAKDKNNSELISLASYPTPKEGRSHILYFNGKKYIAHICKSRTKKHQKLILIKDITSLIDQSEDFFYTEMLEIKTTIQKLSDINESIIFVTDQNGTILQSSILDEKEESENLNMIKQYVKNNPNLYKFDDNKLQIKCSSVDENYTCTNYFKPLNFFITATKTKTKILEYSLNIVKDCCIYVLIFLSIGATISVFIVRRVTISLQKIADKAQTIANADLNDIDVLHKIYKNEYDSNYEINKIYEAFSMMIHSLNKNIRETLTTNAIKNRIETELNVAHDIQMGMLPNKDNTPTSKSLEIESYLQPAKEVGGDFFDIFRINEHSIAITIGDVSDKGVPAAMFMSICVTTLRQLLKTKNNVSTTLCNLNNVLSERNPNMMFVTLFVAIFDEKTGKFSYGNAGHCQPCIIKANNTVTELIGLSGPAIGVMENIPYQEYEGKLDNDEYLFVYTDGVSEAQNSNKEFFEVKNILSVLKNETFKESKSVIDKMLSEVITFRETAPQSDDITMMSIKYKKLTPEKLEVYNSLLGNEKPILPI